MNREHILDDWLPIFDASETHRIRVDADASTCWESLRTMDLGESRVVRLLFGARGIRSTATDLDSILEKGFTLLEESPPDHLVMGMVGRPHRSQIDRVSVAGFREYDVPGSVRILWSFSIEPHGHGSAVTTVTRIQATDAAGRRGFLRYWRFVRPFSGLTRVAMLRLIRRKAESAAV